MALLYADSFEHQDETRYTAFGDQGNQFVAGRNGFGMEIGDHPGIGEGGWAFFQDIVGFTGDTLIVGFALNNYGFPDTGQVCTFESGGIEVARLSRDTSGQLQLENNAGILIAYTGVATMVLDAWHYVEFKVKLNATTGTAELRLDGAVLGTFSGNTGSTVGCDDAQFAGQGSASAQDMYVDDLVIMDGSGSGCNDFLGPVWVQYLNPNDNGLASSLTGSDADQTDNYDNVNDIIPDSTDYNGSTGIGDYDYYALPDLSGLVDWTVHGVQVVAQTGRNSGSASYGRLLATNGTSTDFGAINALTSSFVYDYMVLSVNPNGSTWNTTGFSDLQVGFQVTGATGV